MSILNSNPNFFGAPDSTPDLLRTHEIPRLGQARSIVTLNEVKGLGRGGGDALPQMFRRCCWLNMTIHERGRKYPLAMIDEGALYLEFPIACERGRMKNVCQALT